MYLPGEDGGEATYDLLFGRANPSGRLSETWPHSYSDVPFGGEFTKTTNDRYKESIFVGYRYYTSYSVPVKYPFGFGLSYTDFKYSDLVVEKKGDDITVSVTVSNVGERDGSAVVEVFVKAPCSNVIKPQRELRGFEKVFVPAGESRSATCHIPLSSLSYYIDGRWQLENGQYTVEICSDANTPILSAPLNISEGVEISANAAYSQLYGRSKEDFLAMTDSDFDGFIGREIPTPKISRPYDLNTPMREYKTFGGKLLFGAINLAFKTIYNLEKRAKDSPDKETKVKNSYFGWQTIRAMSLRSISYASEGLLSHHMATVLLDLVNNHPLRAIGKLFKPEKCIDLPE
jgi:beta-glucosidase